MNINQVGHVLAYQALGLLIPSKSDRGISAATTERSRLCATSFDVHKRIIANIMAQLLHPASFNYFLGLVELATCGTTDEPTFCYRCACCGELMCAAPTEWENADIMLELGEPSGVLAVHVTLEGTEWWMEHVERYKEGHSASVHGADEWYILFRCDPEHHKLSGLLAPGVRVLSDGERIKLPHLGMVRAGIALGSMSPSSWQTFLPGSWSD